MVSILNAFINGEYVADNYAELGENINPAKFEVINNFQHSSKELINTAVSSAQEPLKFGQRRI